MPVNCSVLESLGRHQRAWAASCSELQIPSRLNVDAWPSRLDQPLIHSLGPGNYWVSTEPHAAASNTHAQHARAHKGGVGHRNAQHAGRPGCHENRQRCSQIHQCLSPWRPKLGRVDENEASLHLEGSAIHEWYPVGLWDVKKLRKMLTNFLIPQSNIFTFMFLVQPAVQNTQRLFIYFLQQRRTANPYI